MKLDGAGEIMASEGHRGYLPGVIPDSSRVLDEAMKLPAQERARLAARLLSSLDAEPDADVDVEAARATELERRAERVLAGEAEFEDWEVVRERLRPPR